MIQKWNASLQRRGHARLVAPSKQIVGQPELRIHVEHAVQRVRGIRASQMFGEHGARLAAVQVLFEIFRKQSLFGFRVEKWKPVDEAVYFIRLTECVQSELLTAQPRDVPTRGKRQ